MFLHFFAVLRHPEEEMLIIFFIVQYHHFTPGCLPIIERIPRECNESPFTSGDYGPDKFLGMN